MAKYEGFKTGFYAPLPNHQLLRMVDLDMEDCAILYAFFYDGVAHADSYSNVHTYNCPDHGDFERREDTAAVKSGNILGDVADGTPPPPTPPLAIPCPRIIEDEMGGLCELPAVYKSTTVEAACFWGKPFSLSDIARQCRLSYPTACRRAAELVDNGFLRREQDPQTELYSWWVADCFKHNNARLLAMKSESANPLGDLIGRERKKKANNIPELCPDCNVMVGFNDLPKHKCEEKKQRLAAELIATMKPDVLSFYRWVSEDTLAEPEVGDNERLQSLIDGAEGTTEGARRLFVMTRLNHLTHKGYWNQKGSGKVGVNSLKFVVANWGQMCITYTSELKKEAQANKQKAALKGSPVERATKKSEAEIAGLQAQMDEDSNDAEMRREEQEKFASLVGLD
jgi:hypothetical protein